MKIIRAEVLGFCFGVRRAVELAEKELENSLSKVYSLGPLIHNEEALKKLYEKGLICAQEDQIENITDGSTVIIRAHGVSPVIVTKLLEKKCRIVDATCPRVKASQKMVEKYSINKDSIILTGDKNHGEVKAIAGYADNNFYLIQDAEEAEQLSVFDIKGNVILMSQTTFSPVEFSLIEKILKNKIENLTVMNTICPATNERQNALIELCKKVDGVLIIGGKNSANTKRLYQTAEKLCKNAVHIQCALDIPQNFYSLNTIGITAGASTPDSIIKEVESALEEHNN